MSPEKATLPVNEVPEDGKVDLTKEEFLFHCADLNILTALAVQAILRGGKFDKKQLAADMQTHIAVAQHNFALHMSKMEGE